ncbi:MAG: hypothetical protein NC453_23095 [Muribaculum sp.]|nr:hypothetical protein [Muribaculum sp.]
MNIPELKNDHQKLLDHLVAHNYNKVYIKEVQCFLDILFRNDFQYDSYEEFWERYISEHTYSASWMALKKMYLNTIQSFDEYGHLPDGRPHAKLLYTANYKALNATFRNLADVLEHRMTARAAEGPHPAPYTTFVLFLKEMQAAGASTLDEITDTMVLRFFMTGKRKGSAYTQSHLRAALKKSPTCLRICRE